MIHALEATRLVEQQSNIFDESISNDPTPVLQPTPWGPSNIALKNKKNIKNFSAKNMRKTKNFFTKGMQKIKDFGGWLLNYIPPKPKVVDTVLEYFKNKIKEIYEKRDTLFQPSQSKYALKNVAMQYQIKGLNGYDPESFLPNSNQPITNPMLNTRQTKVKLILSGMMEKVDLKSGELITKRGSISF